MNSEPNSEMMRNQSETSTSAAKAPPSSRRMNPADRTTTSITAMAFRNIEYVVVSTT